MSNEVDFDDGTWDHIHSEDLTWWEDCLAWVGWFICEIAFQAPDFAWQYLLYPSWCHTLGGWVYGKAFSRWYREHKNEEWM